MPKKTFQIKQLGEYTTISLRQHNLASGATLTVDSAEDLFVYEEMEKLVKGSVATVISKEKEGM